MTQETSKGLILFRKKAEFDPRIKLFGLSYDKEQRQTYLHVYNLNEDRSELSAPISRYPAGCIKVVDIDGLKLLVGTNRGINCYELRLNETGKLSMSGGIEETYLVESLNHRIKTIDVFKRNGSIYILAGRRRSYVNMSVNCGDPREGGWSEFYLFDSEQRAPIRVYDRVNKAYGVYGYENPLSTATIDDLLCINDERGVYAANVHDLKKQKYLFEAEHVRPTGICALGSGKGKLLFLAGPDLYKFEVPKSDLSKRVKAVDGSGCRQVNLLASAQERNEQYLITAGYGNPGVHSTQNINEYFELRGTEQELVLSLATLEIESNAYVFASTHKGRIAMWRLDEPKKPKRVFRGTGRSEINPIFVAKF